MNGVRQVKNVSRSCRFTPARYVSEQTPSRLQTTNMLDLPDSFRWRFNQELPMPKSTAFTPSWDTSSFGHPADISPLERSALGEHLSLCGQARGPLQTLRTGAGLVRGFVMPRLVTTVFFIALMAGTAWLAS